jgi:DNA-binding NarL/FixJ family response regulator
VRTRLLPVDDHSLFREGFTRFLASEPDFEICGRAYALRTHLVSYALDAVKEFYKA